MSETLLLNVWRCSKRSVARDELHCCTPPEILHHSPPGASSLTGSAVSYHCCAFYTYTAYWKCSNLKSKCHRSGQTQTILHSQRNTSTPRIRQHSSCSSDAIRAPGSDRNLIWKGVFSSMARDCAEELNEGMPARGNAVHRFCQLWDLTRLHDVSHRPWVSYREVRKAM